MTRCNTIAAHLSALVDFCGKSKAHHSNTLTLIRATWGYINSLGLRKWSTGLPVGIGLDKHATLASRLNGEAIVTSVDITADLVAIILRAVKSATKSAVHIEKYWNFSLHDEEKDNTVDTQAYEGKRN